MLIYRVQRYVQAHLGEALSVQTLAGQLGVSRSYLSSHFREVTGKNLSDYIRQQKMDTAKTLLKATSLSHGEIAAQLGFSSQSHFQSVFKKETGLTPREYREKSTKPFEA